MLDLETFGTQPNSAIAAIGAVHFADGEIIDQFYRKVDLQSCVQVGLSLDPSTIMWWVAQEGEAKAEILKPGTILTSCLIDFIDWLPNNDVYVWGNGVSFDNVILRNAYEKSLLKVPWKWTNDRCYRTLKNLFPSQRLLSHGTKHNALDDAIAQTKHLLSIFKDNPILSI